METREHELIRQKIEAVTSLPEGYTPNLASKWELLEAGLKPKEKKRPLVWISAISAAAVLLFVSTVVMMSMQQDMPVPQQSNATTKPQAGKVLVKEQQVVQQEVKPEAKPNRRKRIIPAQQENKNEMIATVQFKDTNITPQETVVAVIEKAPRFVEMDFKESVINNQVPSETVIASQRFKFRIGFGGQSSASTQSSKDRSLFSRKIN